MSETHFGGKEGEQHSGDELLIQTSLQSHHLVNMDSPDGTGTDTSGKETEVLSKRQQKKLKKHEQWLQNKAERRKEEKLKKKRKFAEARERGDLGPSRKALKRNCMKDSSCKQQVVIDCSFDEYMSEKDVIHLVQQIQHSYSANRRADNPLQYYVCGVSGKVQKRLEQIGDYKGWDVSTKTESYLDIFPKESVVYLSSDSPTVLQHLDDSKVYIIGGLVDHNHYKGLCHELAVERGVSHAQLPITEYIDMKTRKVLTVNHVFEILLRYTESRDWKKAFFQVLPQRKGLKEKEEVEEELEHPEEEPTESLSSLTSEPTVSLVQTRSEPLSHDPSQSEPLSHDSSQSEPCNNDTHKDTSCSQKEGESNSKTTADESDFVGNQGREVTPSNTVQPLPCDKQS